MEVFAISPASAKPLWFIAVICTLLALVLLALAFTAYAARNSRVELGADKLTLVGDFWGRDIPLSNVLTEQARVVNLDRDGEIAPRRRTLGTGLPGYASGWFKLYNGDKALLYLTNRKRAVYVPTSEGYSLLLSVQQPGRFIESLKQFSGNHQR